MGFEQERRGSAAQILSADARLVQAVMATFRERRMACYPRTVHEALRRHDASWTDERFLMAWQEVHPDLNPYRPGASPGIS
jgi:hypothetical protein